MDEAKFANDFEERHGWSPDIGYEVVEPKPKKKKKEPKPSMIASILIALNIAGQ